MRLIQNSKVATTSNRRISYFSTLLCLRCSTSLELNGTDRHLVLATTSSCLVSKHGTQMRYVNYFIIVGETQRGGKGSKWSIVCGLARNEMTVRRRMRQRGCCSTISKTLPLIVMGYILFQYIGHICGGTNLGTEASVDESLRSLSYTKDKEYLKRNVLNNSSFMLDIAARSQV